MGSVSQLRPSAGDRLRPIGDERALLEIVLDGNAAHAAYLLEPDDLCEAEHQHVLRAARAVHEQGGAPNAATVLEQLARMDRRVNDKLVVELACPDIIPLPVNAPRHARAVRQASRARFELAQHERAVAYYRAGRFEEAADIEREMAARATATGFARPMVLAEEAIALYEGRQETHATARTRIDLGWAPWQRTIGPVPAGSLFVVGAAPGVGKSSLMLMTALEVARGLELHTGPRVGIVSIEDPMEIWATRALAYESGIPIDDITERRFGGVEREIGEALERMVQMGIVIICAPGATVEQVEQHMTCLVREHACALVGVDYLQAVRVGRGDAMERTSEAGARIKACGARLGVPVMLASQLSRPEPGSEYKEPAISRLRYSGDIEAMAEVIAMVYRTEAPPDNPLEPEELAMRIAKVKWRRPGALIELVRQPSGLIVERE